MAANSQQINNSDLSKMLYQIYLKIRQLQQIIGKKP